jgi:hypothetical protein
MVASSSLAKLWVVRAGVPKGLTATGLSNPYAGSVGKLAILGGTANRNVPRTAWAEVNWDTRNKQMIM